MRLAVVIMAIISLLSACSTSWKVEYDEPLDRAITKDWSVRSVLVEIPPSLTVSDANVYIPSADIVWHGDPAGNRRDQVSAIMHQGVKKGAMGLTGNRPVRLVVTLSQFHAVTPAAVSRAPSAVHNIKYNIQAFDMRTDQPLTQKVEIIADLEAYTGAAAIIAAQQGQTQKVRIIDHLVRITNGWLGTGPDPRRKFGSLGR